MRIAAWSGPRNLSTAMMYAFAARGDCAVADEPFYAAYLRASGLNHPMREEILAAQPNDAAVVAAQLSGSVPGKMPHFYMKLMAHHMLADMPLDWARSCVNLHLIRHPARVIASYGARRDAMTLADIGYPQQAMLLDQLGGVVIDSEDIRADLAATLARLCAALGVSFTDRMLRWPAGPKPFDGVWAPHWYGAVHQSTGFAGAEGPLPVLTGREADLLAEALPIYNQIAAARLRTGA